MDSSEGCTSYHLLQAIKEICKSSNSKAEAEQKLRAASLWHNFANIIPHFRPYMDLP